MSDKTAENAINQQIENDKKERERDRRIDMARPPNAEHLAYIAALLYNPPMTVQFAVEMALGIIDHAKVVHARREVAFEVMRDKERGL